MALSVRAYLDLHLFNGWIGGMRTFRSGVPAGLARKSERSEAAGRADSERPIELTDKKKKKKVNLAGAWQEARALVWAHRRRLSIGLGLMLINRLAGLVLPATSKYLIDEVIGKHRAELLMTLALAAGAATL